MAENADTKYHASPNTTPVAAEGGDNRALSHQHNIKLEEQQDAEHFASSDQHELKSEERQGFEHPALPHQHNLKLEAQTNVKYPAPPNFHEIKLEKEQKADNPASLAIYQMLPHKPKEFPVLAILHKTMPDKVKDDENSTLTNQYKMKYADDAHNTSPPVPNNSISEAEQYAVPQNISEKAKDDECPALSIVQKIVPEEEQEAEFPFPPILIRIGPNSSENSDSPILFKLMPEIVKHGEHSSSDDETDSCNNDKKKKPVRRFKGTEYYDYYQEVQGQDYYTMYRPGKTTLPVGTILHFSTNTDNIKREDIKQALLTLGANIAFIDYQMGNKEGWIRLKEEFTAKVILQKMTDGKIKIAESDVVFRVLTGKEQKKYLKKAVNDMFGFRTKVNSLSSLLKKRGYRYVTKFND